MRFEKVIWTLLALFIVGSSLTTDPLLETGDGGRYEAADGEQKIPPAIMDGGTSTSALAPFTR
jgi:hypothetical protein